MLLHASCAARDGHGALLVGPSGAGKSDLLLRLLSHGFALVADDQVDITDGIACSPPQLAGLLEVRGLGIMRLPYVPTVVLALTVRLGRGERLPHPERDERGLPVVCVDPTSPSAPERISLALSCVTGKVAQVSGAFT